MKKTKGKTSQHIHFQKAKDDTEEYDYENYESPKWFNEVPVDPKKFTTHTEQVLIELKDEAKKCHDSEVANYNIKNQRTNSNYQWMKTVMSKGTVSDKIAAHTVEIQNNPVCNLETIRNLVGMVKVGKNKTCTSVIDTLTELYLSDLLRPEERLKPFHQRPLSALNDLSSGNAVTRRKILSYWFFEDQLKEIYTQFVLALNTVAQDTVDANKEKAINAMYKLLAGNPEQEKNLLTYIINKLGDPSQKVASKAIYCLTQLLFKHSNMQGVVLLEIEKLLFRANIASRAQYYCLCFLSQFYLNHEDSEVAKKLIDVYLSFFKACVKKGEVDTRMMSALLMGINRAYPYAKLEYSQISEHIDTMYRLVHIANFNISLHALSLLYQISDFGNNINDRFYSALYKKLLDPKLLITTHQAMLLSLVYKVLLKDTEEIRVKVFVKRLLQIAKYTQPCFSCGILYLISQLIGKRKSVLSLLLKRNTSRSLVDFEDDDEEEKYHDIKDEDEEIKKEPLDEEEKSKILAQEPKETIELNDDEDDVKPDVKDLITGLPGWNHASLGSAGKNGVKKELTYLNKLMTRNPLYVGAECCVFTELNVMRKHFHPTVALFASNILKGETIKYQGDPLKDFTLVRFLDRFVFKNPRHLEDSSGAHPTFGKRKAYKPRGIRLLAVNSKSYLRENEHKIPAEELFMYTYLQQRFQDREPKDDGDSDSDAESVQSEEFEDMLDKMAGYKDLDDQLDYMNEIGDNLKSKNKGKKGQDDEDDMEGSDEEIDDEEEEDMDDEELEEDGEDDFGNEEDQELLGDLDDDEDDDDVIEFGNDSEDGEEEEDKQTFSSKSSKKTRNILKNPKSMLKKSRKDDIHSVFASADEFAALLEDEGSSKIAPGSSNAFSNKDNAAQKQVDWESKRNRWISGYNKALGKGKSNKGKGGGGKSFGKKRENSNKFGGNKNKKFKK